jgi:hypothetical protein
MSLSYKSSISTDVFHTYYNISIFNNDTRDGQRNLPIIFSEYRNSPYLIKPREHFASVVRFSIQSPSIPLFVPLAKISQLDPNILIYQIGMEYSGVFFKVNIYYYPQDLTQSLPTPPLTFQDYTSKYYNIYSYDYWAYLVNLALSACYDGLALATVLPVGSVPPYMTFADGKYSMIADNNFFNTGIDVASIKIYFNKQLNTLLSGFPTIFNTYVGLDTVPWYKLQMIVTDENEIKTNIFKITQNYTTIGLMTPVEEIVFNCSLLPVHNTLISPPKIFNTDAGLFTGNGNNSNISPVLTDFQVAIDASNNYIPTINYSPLSEYRLIDLISENPLSGIELSVFWKDGWGNLHPVELYSGCKCTVKLMFRRKSFNAIDV